MLWPIVTIQYRCDTSRDVIWCHDFGHQTLKSSYFDLRRSAIVVSKNVGPSRTLSRSIHSMLLTVHGFVPTAPLRHQHLTTSYLGFLRCEIVVPKHVGPSYTRSWSIYSVPWSVATIQYQSGTSSDVILCHDFYEPTVPLRRQMLKIMYLDFLRSVIVVPKHAGPTSYTYPLLIKIFNSMTYHDNPVPMWHLPRQSMMSWFWAYDSIRAPSAQNLSLSFRSFTNFVYIVPWFTITVILGIG